MKRAVFALIGVDCAACSPQIEREIRGMRGVGAVSVNAASSELFVEFDGNVVTEKQIAERLKSIGYDAIYKKSYEI